MSQVITVQIQSELGEVVAGPIFWECPPLPGVNDGRFPCLRFVDPYGDTIFNQLQIPIVLQDLRLLAATALEQDQVSQIRNVEELIEPYAQNAHFYLKLIGD
jgi:hypothetical protein